MIKCTYLSSRTEFEPAPFLTNQMIPTLYRPDVELAGLQLFKIEDNYKFIILERVRSQVQTF